MAVLGSTSLTGCLYIESFLGGQDPNTLGGFRAIFENASAPTSWVKDTSYSTSGIALRVTTGNIQSRTNFTFAQTFTSRSLGLTIQQNASAVTIASAPGNITANQQVASTTTTTQGGLADLGLHDHTYESNNFTTRAGPASLPARANNTESRNSSNTGGNAQHTHNLTFTQHAHPVTSSHTHTISGQHDHTISAPTQQENFAVIYRDVIIAEKSRKP